MKVADLYAALSIKPDLSSFNKSDAFLKKAKSRVDGFAKAANDKLSSVLRWGTVGIGAGLMFGARDALKFDEALTTLRISAAGAMGSTDAMRGAMLGLSKATGVAKEDLVAGAQAYVALTGDGKGAIEAVRTFARVSKAAATPMADVSGAAAAMAEQFGILPSQMESAFSILIAGGKAGKIELNDMANLTAELGASFKRFSGSQGLDGMAQLGAMFQLSAKDAGSAATASNNLVNLMNNIKNREFDLKGAGMSVRTGGKAGKGPLKGLLDIVRELDKLQKKNPEGFIKAFGKDAQANAAFEALRNRIGLIEELTEKTRNSTAVAEDLAIRQASRAEQASRAWNNLKNKVTEAFTPERIAQITSLLDTIVSAVDKIVNAFGGLDRAVIAVLATFAALKGLQIAAFLVGITSQLMSLAAAAAAAGTASKGLAALGGLSAAGAVVAAGATGYAVGTALDQAFGWSDWISDKLAGVEGYRDSNASQAMTGKSTVVNLTVNAATTDVETLAKKTAEETNQALMRTAAAATGVR